MLTRLARLAAPAVAIAALLSVTASTPLASDLPGGLQWRNIGPFRGGRISAVSGAIGEPGTFYAGLPAAGVWKTTSAGETWYPVFDSIRDVSSVGAVEVAPSNPNIVYVGTGDLITGGTINEGNGVYKSTDAGKSWTHLGLDATKQIPSIIVDPRNPDVVLIAAQGDIHVKSESRGVFRSSDGGRTWTRTLFAGDSIGIQKLAIAQDRPDVIFASTVRHYTAPLPPSGVPALPAAGAAGVATQLYKSTDNGITWKEISGGGLPRITGRTGVAVAMNTNAQRVFIVTNTGLYRSDDGGTTWRQMDPTDLRIRNGQGGYNCGVYVDPKNPDIIYSTNTALYKSIDGGNTFTGFKGAPGGDDPQQLWIDPTNGSRMLAGYDQGAIVTLDGGHTWSSWYNQNTEQVYHIAVDNSAPYWIYATQQDAGAIRTRSRGNLGAITPMDWNPVPGWEWGTILPDPLNNNIVYSSGNGLQKIFYPTEQWISVSPAINTDLKLRTAFSQPIIFAPWNQKQLLAGFQYVMSTLDGGAHWKKLSPDLGYAKGVIPPPDSVTPAPGTPPGGAIETIAPSPIGRGTIWVGTNNGLINVTTDEGKTWTDVSVPNVPFPARALVSTVEASPTEAGGAYAVIDIHTAGDYTPHIYRTKDFGKTWTPIVKGLRTDEPSGSYARVVRADPKRAGLLFAGTESGMYVSFDDGDNWQSLQKNLPNTSYRDIRFKGNDLVVGTYGRGIWILDDYAVLRQVTPTTTAEAVHLFAPDPAIRTRRNVGGDTPFPPEVPHALNPLDGVFIHYSLAKKPDSEVTIDVLDSAGVAIRHMSTIATAPVKEAAQPPHPTFWLAEPFTIPAEAGMNRTAWDLRYDAPPAFTHSYEINANPGLTPPSPEGRIAPPGVYTIALTVNGKRYTQKATVLRDPMSPATAADLRAQTALLRKMQDGMKRAYESYQQVAAMRSTLAASAGIDATSAAAKAVANFRAKVDSIGGNTDGSRGFGGRVGGRTPPPTFVSVHGRLVSQFNAQDNGDHAPTEAMLTAYGTVCRDLSAATMKWQALNTKELTALNGELAKSGRPPVLAATVIIPKC
jgi:photosystem II stability/assembly factor-like uncharacterized protein